MGVCDGKQKEHTTIDIVRGTPSQSSMSTCTCSITNANELVSSSGLFHCDAPTASLQCWRDPRLLEGFGLQRARYALLWTCLEDEKIAITRLLLKSDMTRTEDKEDRKDVNWVVTGVGNKYDMYV